MSDKKDNILAAALELFAGEGYNAVSTSKIAQKAGVSEGLIFRHFGNKKGLLNAIMQDAEDRIQRIFAAMLFEEDPKSALRKFIVLPFEVKETDFNFWRLQFKLKWEPEYNKPEKMKPVLDKLAWAFSKLGADAPEQEAQLLSHILDNIAIAILRNELTEPERFKQFLLTKYQV